MVTSVHRSFSADGQTANRGQVAAAEQTFWQRVLSLIASEHICAPPAGFSQPVPHDPQAASAGRYQCPDCGQVFRQPPG